MTRRILALAAGALVLAAGCHNGSAGPAFRLAQPTSLAVFQGYSHKIRGVLHPYVAVANSAQDELVLVDPVNDSPVGAPVLIRPLSIPLLTPRPAMVASATFYQDPDSTERKPRPDLLVAVAAGSTELQLIRTWRVPGSADPDGSDPGLEGAPIDLGGEIVALVATPMVDGSGAVVWDHVRVVAALTGGRLAVVEYQWTGDPDAGGSAAPVSGTPAVQDLGFDAVSLAVDTALDGTQTLTPPERPRLVNPRFLYAATLDRIGPSNTQGVAQLDMGGAAGAWTIRALDAHAPTRLVAAFTLRERVIGVDGAYDQITSPAPNDKGDPRRAFDIEAAPVPRVYAYRDPASCGPTTPEQCGIVVLDPDAADVLENPWHTGQSPKQYLPPISVPGNPVALVAGPPAWNPPGDAYSGLETVAAAPHSFMSLVPGTAVRMTTGVLIIPAADGRSYVADLGRWEIPSSILELQPADEPAGVRTFLPSALDFPQIGFYIPRDVADADASNGAQPRLTWDPTETAELYIHATPGFVPADAWTLAYQGYLPAFAGGQPGLVEDAGAGLLRVAFQASTTTHVVNVFDPALGVRVGDIVEIWTTGGQCPDTTQKSPDDTSNYNAPVEGKIVSVDRPDADHPGGSVVFQRGDCVPIEQVNGTECDGKKHGPWTDKPNCWAATPSTDLLGQRLVRIRAGGGGDPGDFVLDGKELVLSGALTGYAGRATTIPTPASPQDPDFQLTNEGEDALVAACPDHIIPYPSNWADVPACDESCRRRCEQAAIARRVRRDHLPSVYCYKGTTELPGTRNYCETYYPELALPQGDGKLPAGTFDGEPPTGPALAFSVGVHQPPAAASPMQLVRDTQVTFTTASGRLPASRYGGGADNGPATGPAGAATFDRSFDPGWDREADRLRFYVPHVGNLILDATPSHSNGDTHVLR